MAEQINKPAEAKNVVKKVLCPKCKNENTFYNEHSKQYRCGDKSCNHHFKVKK